MQTYVLMTKLSPEAGSLIKKRAKAGQAWMKQVKKACPKVKFIGHWAVLGDFDFISIYESGNNGIHCQSANRLYSEFQGYVFTV